MHASKRTEKVELNIYSKQKVRLSTGDASFYLRESLVAEVLTTDCLKCAPKMPGYKPKNCKMYTHFIILVLLVYFFFKARPAQNFKLKSRHSGDITRTVSLK